VAKKDSPFGVKARRRALTRYFQGKELRPDNAWEHVYRLLLSVERRTRLAHVYDANHMQPGGNFHARAFRFTSLLCKRWGIRQKELPEHVDFMFQRCVEGYLAEKAEAATAAAQQAIAAVLDEADGDEGEEETKSEFLVDIAGLLSDRLGTHDPNALADLAIEIERRAEHYFTIERKRQNVRGEGFEDTLEWLLLRMTGLSADQVRVRQRASDLPGFKPELRTEGKSRDKIPKPDVALTTPDGTITLWLVTAKWSLRQDRLDQFGQEAAYYKANTIQGQSIDFVLITNEMDVARLRDVLTPPEGPGGFHFQRVYHLNCDLLIETHGDKFKLDSFRESGRLLSMEDFFAHAAQQVSPSALTPRTPRRG